MNTPVSDSESQTTTKVSKDKAISGSGRPDIPEPEPISPGSANVIISLESIVAGPGSQATGANESPRRAKAKVETVLGYGAGFQEVFGDGQVIQVYFPAGMKLDGEEIRVQQKLKVNLQAPLVGSSWFTVNSFSKVQ